MSILSYAGGTTDNFVKAVIAASCGAAVAFVLTYLFGFSKKELEGEID